MDRKAQRAKIAELRDAAEQARALSVDLTAPEAEQGFLELARKLDEEAAVLEQAAVGKRDNAGKTRK